MEYGLIGRKLGHSFSKEIHENIGKYNYDLIELDEKQFIEFMQKKEFKAINVTIPYKEQVIPYLHYIQKEAKKINAVNTIINKNGLLYGYNTDYYGLKEMVSFFNIDVYDKNVLILGTGGTSKTVTQVLKDLNVKNITYASTSKKENTISYEQIDSIKQNIEVLINTTPFEMYPNNEREIISLERFNLKGVIDVIYNPLNSNLILKAKQQNINCCSGLYMLVAQAFYAIEMFINAKLDKRLIEATYYDLLKQKQNIVFIGMPSSGKTTIGMKLSKLINKEFIDIDKEIINIIKMEISEFFKTHSEDEFRDIESKVIARVSKMNNVIISTGGGSILRDKNINLLKQNGKLFFLDRNINLLLTTSTRPLSSTKDDLYKLYEKRYPIYLKNCDERIDANKSVDEICNEIISR